MGKEKGSRRFLEEGERDFGSDHFEGGGAWDNDDDDDDVGVGMELQVSNRFLSKIHH